MRFRRITQENVREFLPIDVWNDDNLSALLSDAAPNKSLNGSKVMFYFDDHFVFGEVTKISGRHATVRMEESIGSSQTITVNWSHLRMADDKYRKKEKAEAQKTLEQINLIRSKIQIIKNDIKNSFFSEKMDATTDEVYEIFSDKYNNLIFMLEEISQLKNLADTLEKELFDLRKQLIESGFDEKLIPNINNSLSTDQEIRANRKRHNAEIKSRLDQIRVVTKMILVETIAASGENGISSEHILSIICEPDVDYGPIIEQINPHRVMGMLSAMSRNKDVRLTENNVWIILDQTSASSA